MRHRSHIAFILLAAALFAAPQMAHDLSTLKGAVAESIRGEILQAFLGLHSNEAGGGAAVQTQAPRAETALASCKADKTEAQPARKKTAERTTTTAQRPDACSQSAMLTDPSGSKSALPPAAAAELASLPRRLLKEARLAMLTPPSNNGVEPPPPAIAFNFARDERVKAVAARERFQGLERHAVFVQARFEPGASEWVRRFADEAARAAEGNAKSRTRVLKVRRQGRACGGDAAAPCVPVASVARPDEPVQIIIGE